MALPRQRARRHQRHHHRERSVRRGVP
jgi:hypothetical protein